MNSNDILVPLVISPTFYFFPEEILSKIFAHLDLNDLKSVRSVCLTWKRVVDDLHLPIVAAIVCCLWVDCSIYKKDVPTFLLPQVKIVFDNFDQSSQLSERVLELFQQDGHKLKKLTLQSNMCRYREGYTEFLSSVLALASNINTLCINLNINLENIENYCDDNDDDVTFGDMAELSPRQSESLLLKLEHVQLHATRPIEQILFMPLLTNAGNNIHLKTMDFGKINIYGPVNLQPLIMLLENQLTLEEISVKLEVYMELAPPTGFVIPSLCKLRKLFINYTCGNSPRIYGFYSFLLPILLTGAPLYLIPEPDWDLLNLVKIFETRDTLQKTLPQLDTLTLTYDESWNSEDWERLYRPLLPDGETFPQIKTLAVTFSQPENYRNTAARLARQFPSVSDFTPFNFLGRF